MDLPKRKPTRLKNYDYSSPGAYFVTICTQNKKQILSKISIVGEGFCALPKNELTPIGSIVEKSICYIDNSYEHLKIDKYVIMPNHIHLLISITGGHGDPPLQGEFEVRSSNYASCTPHYASSDSVCSWGSASFLEKL